MAEPIADEHMDPADPAIVYGAGISTWTRTVRMTCVEKGGRA